MKTLLILFIAGAVFCSCGSNQADQPLPNGDSMVTPAVFSWEAQINDSTQRLEMIKKEAIGPDSLSTSAVIDFLNTTYPNIKLDIVRTSSDTLFLNIDDAAYLTQQMGSTGPTMYFATAVYNLTEIPGIRFVHFQFEEGDHAQPDTFGRDNFKDE